MITSNGIEHWDGFDDVIIFWVDVKGVPINFLEEAKRIDLDNYNENCFGVCVEFTETGFYIVEDKPLHQLYYIDNNGNRNYMNCHLIDDEKESIFNECRNEILRIMGNM